ncbi:VOC family protein [Salinicola acroporae]|uniref:VOC family virulence protein n=1 Tax=Salinicola acroporae TaxID=1541440 RepID=A0ABT6I7Z9_9GAMM|nr:VOC family protein [Salinicola acroporae]MDH4573638.1 VOC family virulence protein [Salinicola acroporae]
MKISQLDHLVLTVADIDATCDFYGRALGMERVVFGEGRIALGFGEQKINLHRHGREFEPKANCPTPGSADLCFLSDTPLEQVISHLEGEEITIIEGPVDRTGATGPIRSIYLRDPDKNLIEIANRMEESRDD